MTFAEQMFLLAVITVVETSLLIARMISIGAGVLFAVLPVVLVAVGAAWGAIADGRAERKRLPQARVVAMRRAS